MKTVFALIWADYCGTTDAASLLGIFSTKELAEKAQALEYDLGYHGRAHGYDDAVTIVEVELDKPLLEAIRLI